MTTPEGRIKAIGQKMMKQYRNVYYHMPVMNGMGKPTLDFIVVCNGHHIEVETKAPGNKPTARQMITIAEVESAGGWVFVVDSQAGWDAVESTMLLLGAIPHDETNPTPSHKRRSTVPRLLQRPADGEEDSSEV